MPAACRHGTLLRYVSYILEPANTTVIGWDAVAALQGEPDCWLCPRQPIHGVTEPIEKFHCKDWFGVDGHSEHADVAVMVACTTRILTKNAAVWKAAMAAAHTVTCSALG